MENVTWNENVIAADSRGNIGYWHPGLHPLRPRNFDERLPYPGTGEAEWRGLLDRRTQTPHVINPRRAFLINWNNVPSAGWTNGDSEARERATGPLPPRAAGWSCWWAGSSAAAPPTSARARSTRPRAPWPSSGRSSPSSCAAARRGGSAKARSVLTPLSRWGGSYHRTDSRGHGRPGRGRLGGVQGPGRGHRAVPVPPPGAGAAGRARPALSHVFDITLGEAYALRTLSRRGAAAGRRAHLATCSPSASAPRTPPAGASRGACTR